MCFLRQSYIHRIWLLVLLSGVLHLARVSDEHSNAMHWAVAVQFLYFTEPSAEVLLCLRSEDSKVKCSLGGRQEIKLEMIISSERDSPSLIFDRVSGVSDLGIRIHLNPDSMQASLNGVMYAKALRLSAAERGNRWHNPWCQHNVTHLQDSAKHNARSTSRPGLLSLQMCLDTPDQISSVHAVKAFFSVYWIRCSHHVKTKDSTKGSEFWWFAFIKDNSCIAGAQERSSISRAMTWTNLHGFFPLSIPCGAMPSRFES